MIVRDHIDPKKGNLVCGLDVEANFAETDPFSNGRKSNRFVPFRICGFPAPRTFGDMGEFLIDGDWVVCEFGGDLWWDQSTKNGTGPSTPASEKQKAAARETGRRNVESGRLKKQASSGGKKSVEMGVGLHAPDADLSGWGRKGGKALAKQRWMCLVTGRVMNAGNLARFHDRNGIDRSMRKRIL